MEQKQNQTIPEPGTVYAALDIGSNSFHLIVARIVDGTLQTLHKVKQRVRLADGLARDKSLSEDAMVRGLETLTQMAQALEGIPQENVRVVATYTLRSAINAKLFLQRAKQVFPYPIEVISGQEEARLIYQGVAHTVSEQGNRLVIDIGGGSTEFIIGQQFAPIALSSRSMGCVSYTQTFFKNGKITELAFQKAIIQAEQELEEIIEQYKNMGWQACFGTSGTIKAIREVIVRAGWSQSEIKATHLEKLKQMLLSFGHVNDINIAGVSEHRSPVLPGGLAVLIAAFEVLNIKSLTYSDAALREGVLYEMEERLKHHDIRERTIESLMTRYYIDANQANRVQRTALEIVQQSNSEWNLSRKFRQILVWACQIHEIGLHINSTGFHKHSAYIASHSSLPGFVQEEQLLIASLLRFQRKKLRLEELPSFTLYKVSKVVRAIRILRIALVINLRRRDNLVPDFSVTVEDESITIQFPEGFLAQEKLLEADLEQEKLMQLDAGFNFFFS
ncbi:exopolyphosphatase [Saccharobesus litoralis]|uniref:Exopolyphosphatase n=1 Tax=Saccharobesus litoralis TaxID=2172099 RepID=A0A2S0VSZ4_9ALTE|nr:exopolyphosphatase [Saccharobesus litoralis]AWB67302.1 exopolyphosphatase [Saccharobesus litoralis]